jgi:integrase
MPEPKPRKGTASPAAPKPRKPATLHIGPLHVRPRRGPNEAGLWYWRADWYRDGKDHARGIGWATPQEAQRLAADLVAREKFEEPKPRGEAIETVRDLLETWAASVRESVESGQIRPSTGDMYINRARHLATVLGEVRLDRVDSASLDAYRDARLRAPVMGREKRFADGEWSWVQVPTNRKTAPHTVAHELRVLRVAWRWGEQRGYCPARRLPSVAVKTRDTRDRRTPTREEVDRVTAALDGWPGLAVLLLAATGARIGEVADLRWRSVDLDGGWIILSGKTGPREVPIEPAVVAALRSAGPGTPDGRVLPVAPKTVRTTLGRDHIAKACADAKIQRFTPHGLRRCAVDSAIGGGVDPGVASKLFGHSPEVMLRHYRTATRDDLRAAVRRSGLGSVKLAEVPDSSAASAK